jgi:GNAT superfamily N-acetyltransferase
VVRPIAGGLAIRVQPGSPLNKISGLGLHGPVTAADLDAAEEVLRPGGGRVVVDLSPLADQSLIDLLASRGYTIAEVENVLVASLSDPTPDDGYGREVEVRLIRPDEALLWSSTLARGFANDGPVSDDMLRIGASMCAAAGCCSYLAYLDGQVAGGGGMSASGGVAALYGTAVLPAHRSRGVQTALLRTRLADARAAGCDLAKIATRPGTTSQRNAERHGFRVVYTKPQMVRTFPA